MLRSMTGAIVGIILAALGTLAVAVPALGDEAATVTGKDLAFDRKKGNCLACHMIDDGELAGNVGPPLLAMKTRYPGRAALRAQIWDASVANPRTTMPPFGRHGILSDDEIDLITGYIHSL